MATLRLLAFSGEIPRLVSRLLPESAAEEAFNTRLNDGGLTPVRLSRFTHRFTAMPEAGYDTIYKNGDEWLGWEGEVFAVPGPVAQDRLYVFGDGVPKMRVAGADYALAVSAPQTALAGVVSGTITSALNATRLYVYTNVTQFGEESEPSPVSNEIDWYPGQAVTLSGFDTTMSNGRTAATQRIYRSQSTTGGAGLYLIDERAASNDDYVDTIPLTGIKDPLPSLDWNPPPDDLTGVISLPNGMMVGFAGKYVYFCEPNIIHAWPVKYMMAVDYNVVGLAAYGTTVVVMTDGHPYIMNGSAPENMQSEKLELNLPCINSRGIQDLGYSIIYPTHEGLVSVSGGSADVISEQVLTRTDWQKYSPRTMVSGRYDGRYLTCYRYSDEMQNEYSGTMIFDVTGSQPFIIRSDITPSAFFYDMASGELFFLDGADVYSWDAPGQVNALQFWKSKEFVLPRPTNFGAIFIEAESGMGDDELAAMEAQRDAVVALNQAMIEEGSLGGAINEAAIHTYPITGDRLYSVPGLNRTVSVSVYADDVHVATVSRIAKMARLPSGFLARRWKVGVSSDMPISQITLATTGAELMGV